MSDERERRAEEMTEDHMAEAGAGAPAEAGSGSDGAAASPAGEAGGDQGEAAVENDIEDLVAQARAERDEYLDLAQRTKADFENYRRRMAAETAAAGTRGRLEVVPGEIVAVGARVCSIYDNDRLEAVVNVLEADLGDLVEGRPALIAVPATGDTVSARVDVLSPSLDAASRTCEVILPVLKEVMAVELIPLGEGVQHPVVIRVHVNIVEGAQNKARVIVVYTFSRSLCNTVGLAVA